MYQFLQEITSDAGGFQSLLRQHLYQRSKRQFPVLEDLRLEFEGGTPTPSSGVGIDQLRGDPTLTYEVDAIGVSPHGRELLGDRVVLEAAGIGDPASHYTQAMQLGTSIFLAGMIPIDPTNSEVIGGFADVPPEGRWLQRHRSHPDSRIGPIAAQTWSLYSRIGSFLKYYGLNPGSVCHATMFLADPGDLAVALRVHERFFGTSAPTLQVVAVDEVGHRGTLIEVECTVSTESVSRVVGAQPFFAPTPDVSVVGHLAFTSDHLGFGRNASLCHDLDDIDALEHPHANALRAIADATDEEAECVVTQLYAALRNLLRSLETAGLDIGTLGHLLIRVRRPYKLDVVDRVCRVLLDGELPAVTVLATHSIPQSEHAVVTVAGICGSDEPRSAVER